MKLTDWLAEIAEAAFRLVPIPVSPGLRVIGKPDRMSPVLLTGNYDLSVRRLRRALRGLDAYLLVANSRGINVWCAASGGHLGTPQVVTALKLAALEQRVEHREIIVPQLAATGIEAKEVRRRTGWIVRFGPADAKDIPAYLAAGRDKTRAMREVRFSARQRVEMAAMWATPMSLIAAVPGCHHLSGVLALIWGLALAVFFLYERLPLPERGRQALVALSAVVTANVVLALAGALTPLAAALWSLAAIAVTGLLTFDYAGSSPTAAAGALEDKAFRVVLDTDRCTGAYTCWAVCPEGVFEKQPELHQVARVHTDRCIRCGACIVQCPQDALAFEAADGRRVEPDVIRRFKLNLLGKRARPSPADTAAAP